MTSQLDLGRLAAIQGLHSVPVITPEFLFNKVLPPLPPTLDFEKLQHDLRSKHGPLPMRILAKECRCHRGLENCVFRLLVNLFSGIAELVFQDNNSLPMLRMQCTPNPTCSSMRTNNSRPDGFLELLERKIVDTDDGKANWEDIAVSLEFTKSDSDSDQHDNRVKIIWSLHQMMRNDPSRRFAFGITIEDTEMRVWFGCRSVLLVSQGFDVWKDLDMIIRLFVSLAFSTTSQLGYDPTVKRIKQNGGVQYDFLVGDTTYRTLSVLSDSAAESLLGRGTRVFQVYDTADPTRTPGTLKDVWVETDRKREGAILADVLEKIGSTSQGQDLEAARRHFLTVLCHEDVVIHGRMDHTKHFWGGEEFPAEYDVMQLPAPEGSYIPSAGGVWVNPCMRMLAQRKLEIHDRAHYRIVFKEVGVAMHYLPSLCDACQALRDAVEGLRLMHAHGYVHRDVSSGNIIFHDGRGKISDFEYAKEVGTGAAHEVRTGTTPFMAIEVALRTYIFQPTPSRQYLMDRIRGHATRDRVDRVPFAYNPLHDLESVWWIANFLIFHNFTVVGHDRQRLNIDSHKLFSTSDFMSRLPAFRSDQRYMQIVDHLPAELQTHGDQLDIIRELLIASYVSAESMPDINKAAFDPEIYELLGELFSKLTNLPGSLAAHVNDPKKRLAAGRDEVDKRSKSVEPSSSAGQWKTANKRISMRHTVPRRSTRSRKTVYEQQTKSNDEKFEHSESSQSSKKRRKVSDRKGDQSSSYTAAESSYSVKTRAGTSGRPVLPKCREG